MHPISCYFVSFRVSSWIVWFFDSVFFRSLLKGSRLGMSLGQEGLIEAAGAHEFATESVQIVNLPTI